MQVELIFLCTQLTNSKRITGRNVSWVQLPVLWMIVYRSVLFDEFKIKLRYVMESK